MPGTAEPFALRWNSHEVVLTIGGADVRYAAAWKVGDAMRLSAGGRARLVVHSLGERRLETPIVIQSPDGDETVDLLIGRESRSSGWTISGSMDWPANPAVSDAVIVTVGQKTPAATGDPRSRPLSFTGGLADALLAVPATSRSIPRPGGTSVTRTWTGRGGGGVGERWSTAGSWSPAGEPQEGDVLVFADGGSQKAMKNDLSSRAFTIQVTGGGYSIVEGGVKLAAGTTSLINQPFTMSSLSGSGDILLNLPQANDNLIIGRDNPREDSTYSGNITRNPYGSIFKTGPSTFTYTGQAPGISVTVDQALMIVDGGRFGPVVVSGSDPNLIIKNNGAVASLDTRTGANFGNADGGIGHSGNVVFGGGSNNAYSQTIFGDVARQQLRVTGTVDITNMPLDVTLSDSAPTTGATIFLIIQDGTDPVTGGTTRFKHDTLGNGVFASLIEGATFQVDSPTGAGKVTLRISYLCNAEKTPPACDGTGNDIGLTVVDGAPLLQPDLTIDKTPAAQTLTQGQTGTFTLTVRNVGGAPTNSAVTVRDTLPAGLTALSVAPDGGWTCDLSTNPAEPACTRSDPLSHTAGSNAYPPIVLTTQVSATATIGTRNNVATVSTGVESNTSNNTATAAVTIVAPAPPADLQLTKTASAAAFERGGTGTYTLSVANVGTTTSSGRVTVTDQLPPALTLSGVIAPGWSCSPTTGTAVLVTCFRDDTRAAGTSFDPIVLTVDVSGTTTATSVTNVATLTGGGDPTDDSRMVASGIIGADLGIAKSQNPVPFGRGQTGTFTLTASNLGPAPTHGQVSVIDVVPAGLTATAAAGTGWTCTVGATVTCTRPAAESFGVGPYPAITVTVTVAPNAGTGLTNTATVSGGGDLPAPNNTATIDVAIDTGSQVPDLVITKRRTSPDPVTQGGSIVFTIDVTNVAAVPTTGADVTVQDVLPSALTPVSAAGSNWSCSLAQTVTCTRPDSLAAGAHYDPIVITASVSASAAGTFTNTATVAGGGDTDPVNQSSITFTVADERQPVLSIAKSNSGPFTPGQQDATFTITVSNTGPVPTSGQVTVSDPLPAGLTPASASGPGWTCPVPFSGRVVICTRQDVLAAGESFPPIAIVASVAIDAASGQNIATVSGGGDTTPGSSPPDNYVVVTSPRLRVVKSHEGDFSVGQQNATYSITVSNVGTAPTSGEVVVEDPVPNGMTPVSGSGPGWTCGVSGQLVTCRRSDPLAPRQSYPLLTITVNVGLVPLTTLNIATAHGGGDPNAAPSPPDATTITGQPQLTILKTHADPVVQGQKGLPFAILVSNNGTAPTAGTVVVTDTFPAGLSPVDASGSGWTCNIAEATVSCSRSDPLPVAADYPAIAIRADVSSSSGDVINEAVVTGGGDTSPEDNVSRDPVPVTPPGRSNLVLTKRHDGDFFQGQQGALYHLRVTNFGQAPSSGTVTVTDDVPAGLTPVSATGPGWACSLAGQRVTCSRGDSLAPGNAFPEITLAVNVAPNATDVTNVAVLSGASGSAEDSVARDDTHIAPRTPDLTIDKRHADPFMAGQQNAAYAITVRNVGTAPTTGEVVVTDRLPAGLAPASVSGSGWTCSIADVTVTCRRSDSLPAGAAYPDITLLVTVASNATNLTNTAVVEGGGDTSAGNNVVNDATSIGVSPDPAIELERSTALVVASTAEYEVVVTNLGPGILSGETQVLTEFPSELIPTVGIGDGWRCTRSGQRLTCTRIGQLAPDAAFSTIRLRAFVRLGPAAVRVVSTVENSADTNDTNNTAVNDTATTLPVSGLEIAKTALTSEVAIGGVAGYEIVVTNSGESNLLNATVRDLLPRGFALVKQSAVLRSASRSEQIATSEITEDGIEWPIGTLSPGEHVTLSYHAIVGANAREGRQENRATVDAVAAPNTTITAGPAVAAVNVRAEVFGQLQAVVGRIYEDIDGDGTFGSGDRPVASARVITSTGQAAVTDAAGLYNIPSLGAGSVVIALDPDTIPGGLTLAGGPGGRSWTRLLRTPVGGGGLLVQNFGLRRAAGTAAASGAPAAASTPDTAPVAAPEPPEARVVQQDVDAGAVAPRRAYETRQGSSMLVALGELSFGPAAQEMELFEKDKNVWGYGSFFYQGTLGSAANRLTLAADSHRRLNGTTDRDRLFELDPNDRMYPVFGDASQRQEFATSNSKVFARVERGTSYVMWGDLAGDLPSSGRDGGRWSSYQRHLTGAEVRVANTRGDHVTVRGAQPDTAYARDVFSGGPVGALTLRHGRVLAGTETVAVEVRDRRTPERVLSREVLGRAVDYQLESESGTLFLQRHVSGLDAQLNLVQIVVTYEYESGGLDNLVFGGRASGLIGGMRVGGTFFTEEGADGGDRFSVFGVDLERALPRDGRVRFELPYSHGTPDVSTSVNQQTVETERAADGIGVQAEVEQPFSFWNGIARGSYIQAERGFRNPFSSTITPGSIYAAATAELSPLTAGRLRAGGTYERDLTSAIDARRTTGSIAWDQGIGHGVTLTGGYDGRTLDRSGAELSSGLATAQVRVQAGDRIEARAGREQNLRDDVDPTYPDQTTLGARVKTGAQTSAFYSQRISDAPIVPIGDFAATGVAQIATKGELDIGVESRLQDATALTSQYRIEQGINGPDSFAAIGVFTGLNLGHGIGTTFGLEHAQIVEGDGHSYTSGSMAVNWLSIDRFKATARYEGRHRDGYSSRLTGGVASRIGPGVTTLTRVDWARSADDTLTPGSSLAFLGALALRPATSDRLGWLLSYQFVDRTLLHPTVAPGRTTPGWRHLLSSDGYAQAASWLALHGKIAWQQTDQSAGASTNTYLAQIRAQASLSRHVDLAIEERYLWQPGTDTSREGTAIEIGAWPIADLRLALGYNVHDTRDPSGRDLQGRDKGVYFTISTKLSRLFDLLGSSPAAAR